MLNSLRHPSSRSIYQQHINCKEPLLVQCVRLSHQKRRTRNARVIDYYEGKHIPLILSLAAAPLIYKRRYLVRDQELTKNGNLVDYDVMTELGFADQEEFASWMGKLSAPGIAEQIAEDEGRFLDRSRTKTVSSRNMQQPLPKNVRKHFGLNSEIRPERRHLETVSRRHFLSLTDNSCQQAVSLIHSQLLLIASNTSLPYWICCQYLALSI